MSGLLCLDYILSSVPVSCVRQHLRFRIWHGARTEGEAGAAEGDGDTRGLHLTWTLVDVTASGRTARTPLGTAVLLNRVYVTITLSLQYTDPRLDHSSVFTHFSIRYWNYSHINLKTSSPAKSEGANTRAAGTPAACGCAAQHLRVCTHARPAPRILMMLRVPESRVSQWLRRSTTSCTFTSSARGGAMCASMFGGDDLTPQACGRPAPPPLGWCLCVRPLDSLLDPLLSWLRLLRQLLKPSRLSPRQPAARFPHAGTSKAPLTAAEATSRHP